MKILNFMISMILISAIICVSTGCSPSKAYTSEQIYLLDITDPNKVQLPDSTQVQFPFEHLSNGASFRVRSISSVHYSTVQEYQLKRASVLTSNEMQRKKDIDLFQDKVNETIANIENETAGKSHSIILEPILEELERLSKSENEERILNVYSDLRHIHPNKGINFYDEKTLEQLIYEPEIIRKKLEQMYTIPKDLSGIEVHFYYKSDLFYSLRLYESVAKVMKYVIEKRNGVVYIHSEF